MRKAIGFVGILAVLGGCTSTQYVSVPAVPAMDASPQLQACAVHASGAQKAAFGDDFNGLQLNTQGLIVTAPKLPVGKQQVSAIYDGEGQWFGVREYRKVRFHCMISPAGQVVYSFVRGE